MLTIVQMVKHNSAKSKINLIKIPVLIKCKHSNITACFITNQAVQMHMHSRGDKHRQQSNRENSSSSIPSIWHRGGESSVFCSQGYSPSEDCLLRKVAQETEGKCQADFFFSSCVDTCNCGKCMKNCFLHCSHE